VISTFGSIIAYQVIIVYIVDAFPVHAASAFGVIGILRAIFGFAVPLLTPLAFRSMGFGPAFTLLAGISLLIGFPASVRVYLHSFRVN
jgi:hypothetical protein